MRMCKTSIKIYSIALIFILLNVYNIVSIYGKNRHIYSDTHGENGNLQENFSNIRSLDTHPSRTLKFNRMCKNFHSMCDKNKSKTVYLGQTLLQIDNNTQVTPTGAGSPQPPQTNTSNTTLPQNNSTLPPIQSDNTNLNGDTSVQKPGNGQDLNKSNDKGESDNEKTAIDNNITPVVSTNCSAYGTGNLLLSDFKDVDDKGWIIVNDNGTPNITHNKEVILDAPVLALLKNELCNSAKVGVTIKLGENSSGGIIIRGSDQQMNLVELNSVTKTVSLKQLSGKTQGTIVEQPYDKLNSHFIHSVNVVDTGYQGSVTVEVDGNAVIKETKLPYQSSGEIGLFITSGNATFGNLFVIPNT